MRTASFNTFEPFLGRTAMSRKSSFQNFDDWYNQIQQFRDRWSDEKNNLKDEWNREKRTWSDEWKENIAHTRARNRRAGTSPQGFLAEIVTSIVDAVGYAKEYKQHQQPASQRTSIEREREAALQRREEEYRRLVRKMEVAERRIEKKKRSVAVFTIFTGIWSVAWMFADNGFGAPALIFAGLAAWQFYNVKELEQKFLRLRGEYDQFAQLNTNVSYSPSGEKAILRHAFDHKGRVYPEMLAIESDFSLAEIEQMLAMCVEKRIACIELDDKGRRYYYFSSFDNSDPYDNMTPPA